MGAPKVTVLMPVRDTREDWLWTAIKGLANQDYPNLDLCIGDNGSTRASTINTLALARETWPDRVGIAYMGENAPKGTAYALDAAMAIADPETDFFSKADSDDIFHHTRESRRVEIFKKLPHQVAIVYENFFILNYHPRPWLQPIILHPYSYYDELEESIIPGNSMWRASVYEKIPRSFAYPGYEGKAQRHAEDYNLWLNVTDYWDAYWIDCDPAFSWTYRVYGGSKYQADRKGAEYAARMLQIRARERRGLDPWPRPKWTRYLTSVS